LRRYRSRGLFNLEDWKREKEGDERLATRPGYVVLRARVLISIESNIFEK
jgi:hypothetical protein